MAEETETQTPSTFTDNKSLEGKSADGNFEETPFPEGGARAWSVALGAAGVLFCTFGYVNAFG